MLFTQSGSRRKQTIEHKPFSVKEQTAARCSHRRFAFHMTILHSSAELGIIYLKKPDTSLQRQRREMHFFLNG